MKIHRFYIKDLAEPDTAITDKELIHQLTKVLRCKTGSVINVFNEKLGEWEVEITDIKKDQVSFKYVRHAKEGLHLNTETDKPKRITLYMSIIKNSNFDLVVEKATEIGIDEIVPITTERTIKTDLNYVRLNKIIMESTEQCGRLSLMTIGDIQTLSDAISQSKLYNEQVFFGHINDASMNHVDVSKSSGLFVGPEGGWTDVEVTNFIKENILPLSLGQNVLRAETAAIVGMSRMI